MSGQLGDLVISLSADIARFRDDMGKATKIANDHAKQIASAFDSVSSVVSGVGKAFAGVGAVLAGGAMFGSAIKKTQEVASEVKKLKESFGISAESASYLRIALDDTFVSAETFTTAAGRITKQIVSGSSAFDKLGVSIKDSNGHLRPMIDIMTDVNSRLLKFKEGTDRDVEAQKIYGKGWNDLRDILKLTNDSMADAVARAQELHLVFTDNGLAAVKAYKSAMKDLDDVAESVKVQLGMALLPELTKISVEFGKAATTGIPAFISILHDVEAEITRMAMLADKAGGTMTTFMWAITGGNYTDTGKHWADKNKMFEQRYNDNDTRLQTLAYSELGLDANGNRIPDKNDKNDSNWLRSNGGNPRGNENWNSAHLKELEYLNAFEEKKAAILKEAALLEAEINQDSYDLGLKDLESYLDKKHEISVQEIDAEIAAKKKVLKNARALATSPVTNKDGSTNESKTAAAQFEALQKVEVTEKALIELEGKRAVLLEANGKENLKALKEQERSYKQIEIQLLELTGQTIEAAKKQFELDDQSVDRLKIKAAARKGDMEAQKALFNFERQNAIIISNLELERARDSKEAQIGIAGMNGEFAKQRQLQIELLDIEIKLAELHNEDPQRIEYLKAQRREIEAMTTAAGAFRRAWQKATDEWADESRRMERLAEDIANAMHDSFEDFFFDALQGDMKSFMDYFKGFLTSLNRALAKFWADWLVGSMTHNSSGGGGGWLSSLVGIFSSGAGAAAGGGGGSSSSSGGGLVDNPNMNWGGRHAGGIIGAEPPTFTRSLPASLLADAPRFHKGLLPDEYPAILQRGEGVFTRGQMQALGQWMIRYRNGYETRPMDKAGDSISISVPVTIDDKSRRWTKELKHEIEDTVERYLRRQAA